MSVIPVSFRAGDRVVWIEEDAPATATAATAYLRTNAAAGLTLAGVAVTGGWEFTISSAASAALAVADWTCQITATVSAEQQTVRVASFKVLRSLVYTGSPAALDLRTQAQIDLDSVEVAIRSLTSGAQEYWIGTGNGGRRVRRADLEQLIAWRDRLKAQVAAEQRAEDAANGRNSERSVFVRFT
jgi:membrane-associated protease RseP (regulator of RpoE activity)